MSATLPRSRRTLSDTDLRLLRVFAEIVRHNGFSAAQDSLGMTQATISLHMRNLEERLGLRLCERGRSGFFLTAEGKQLHEAVRDLFGSIEHFLTAVSDIQGELVGRLAFGTVDAMESNRTLGLDQAIGDFAKAAPKVLLDIDIATPQALMQGLLSGRYQIVLVPAQPRAQTMQAIDVFAERQNLYCGRGNSLFSVADAELTPELLAGQPFAGRSYMQEAPICGVDFHWHAVTAHMEGTLLMLLSGAYIGFLPGHYAEASVRAGALRALAPDRMTYDDTFQIVFSRERANRAARLLAEAILRHCKGAA
jgi:LysR family transcriptional regulator, transcriptional activator for bauABCD operon